MEKEDLSKTPIQEQQDRYVSMRHTNLANSGAWILQLWIYAGHRAGINSSFSLRHYSRLSSYLLKYGT